MKIRQRIAACLCATAMALCGCGRASWQLETVPASGKVLLDGKPLTHGNILFVPAQGRAAKAEIQSDGSFVLGTYDAADGAIIGTHKAAIHTIAEGAEPVVNAELVTELKKSPLPLSYSNPEQSGLQFEVKIGEPNSFTIKLKSE